MVSLMSFFAWYSVSTLLGWIAFPLVHKLLPTLPDCGYTLSRPFGLLICGYIYWCMACLGALQNNVGGVIFALLILIVLSIWAAWGDQRNLIWQWVKTNKKLILVSEVVFLVFFGFWAFIRASNPDISYTEKPMELAFINAILRSPSFPPNDPWLSGYSISYYYFGYLIISMLIRITNVDSGIAYNLAASLWFAMTAMGAYGIIFNLFQIRNAQGNGRNTKGLFSLPILGPIFILIVSNLEGILDVMHSLGVFWKNNGEGSLISSFWQWLGIAELNTPPSQPFGIIPIRPDGLVWWRASRVLQDFTFDKTRVEIIDEFPYFSYLLGDLHPHLLSMPFSLIAIGISLNLLLGFENNSIEILGTEIPFNKFSFVMTAIILGGMAFVNTWDFPVYLLLLCCSVVISRVIRYGWKITRAIELFALVITFGVSSILLYLPFYLGFESQASGILPSMIFNTRGVYFWVMFAPMLIPILFYLIRELYKKGNMVIFLKSIFVSFLSTIVFLFSSFVYGAVIVKIPQLGDRFLEVQGVRPGEFGLLLVAAINNRITSPGTWVTLVVILALALAVILRRSSNSSYDNSFSHNLSNIFPDLSQIFVVFLILFGAMLSLFPEYYYLLDQFGTRMNTIFKFYFSTWIIWGVAAAYCVGAIISSTKYIIKYITYAIFTLLIIISIAYPIWGTLAKTNNFHPDVGLTLDGDAYITKFRPDQKAAIDWLKKAPFGIIAEAVGPQYSSYAWVSEHTGLPAVIGWAGHESEWGRKDFELGTRTSDIPLLYQTRNWDIAYTIIKKYDIRYIILSDLERSTYHISELYYYNNLHLAFKYDSIIIYSVPDEFN